MYININKNEFKIDTFYLFYIYFVNHKKIIESILSIIDIFLNVNTLSAIQLIFKI